MESRWQRALHRVLRAVLPAANPDFEHLYPSVRTWLLELDASGRPAREIGLDAHSEPVVIGPIGTNYGTWSDTVEPLMGIDYQDVSASEFDSAWSTVLKRQQLKEPGRREP